METLINMRSILSVTNMYVHIDVVISKIYVIYFTFPLTETTYTVYRSHNYSYVSLRTENKQFTKYVVTLTNYPATFTHSLYQLL